MVIVKEIVDTVWSASDGCFKLLCSHSNKTLNAIRTISEYCWNNVAFITWMPISGKVNRLYSTTHLIIFLREYGSNAL